MNTLPGELAGLIQLCIEQKQGNKEFALFHVPGWNADCAWEAAIGNPVRVVKLGEVAGEHNAHGATPEEAVQRLLEAVQKGQTNASG